MRLSEPRALQPAAVPRVRNRRQGAFSGFCSACPACSGVCCPLTIHLRDTPARVDPDCPLRFSRVPCSRSHRGPRESLDAPENLPKERRRQVALRQLQGEVPGVPNEPPAGLEQPLLQAREGPALNSEG